MSWAGNRGKQVWCCCGDIKHSRCWWVGQEGAWCIEIVIKKVIFVLVICWSRHILKKRKKNVRKTEGLSTAWFSTPVWWRCSGCSVLVPFLLNANELCMPCLSQSTRGSCILPQSNSAQLWWWNEDEKNKKPATASEVQGAGAGLGKSTSLLHHKEIEIKTAHLETHFLTTAVY